MGYAIEKYQRTSSMIEQLHQDFRILGITVVTRNGEYRGTDVLIKEANRKLKNIQDIELRNAIAFRINSWEGQQINETHD